MKIAINSLEDNAKGISVLPGVKTEDVIDCSERAMTVGILEQGTTSGQTTLSLLIPLPDGKYALQQITARQFEGLVGAFIGAQERFKQPCTLKVINPSEN